MHGAREVGFTVLSMSLSLIAVFVPILLMGGIVGRLFREFAMTLSVAILISLVVSLTTTPMMCAYLLADRPRSGSTGGSTGSASASSTRCSALYDRTLRRALHWPALVMLSLLATLGLTVYLFTIVPKGFFPQQDNGRMIGGIQADQSISFQLMQQKLTQFIDIIRAGSGGRDRRRLHRRRPDQFRLCLCRAEAAVRAQGLGRGRSSAGCARSSTQVAGARLFLQAVQDIRVGGRASNAQYQYTLQGDDTDELYDWAPKVEAALQKVPQLTDVNLDQQQKGLETDLVIDRATAARLGLTVSQIDNTLYDAFGQRQVSTIYAAHNQYHVVMEVAPEYWQNPETLNEIYVSTVGGAVSGTQATNAAGRHRGRQGAGQDSSSRSRRRPPRSPATPRATPPTNALANTGRSATSTGAAVSTAHETMVPLSAFAHFGPGNTPLAVNHQSLFVATTISFNLAPGVSLSQATAAIERRDARASACRPRSTAAFRAPRRSSSNRWPTSRILIAAALLAVYIVLGVLYESYVHPITILSTLPSAGRRRGAGADRDQHRVQHHRADRRHPADRHRQEERDHDDRFRARRRAQRGPELARGDLSRPASSASGRS